MNELRREALKKIGLTTGAAYVAPAVTALVIPKHASATSVEACTNITVNRVGNGEWIPSVYLLLPLGAVIPNSISVNGVTFESYNDPSALVDGIEQRYRSLGGDVPDGFFVDAETYTILVAGCSIEYVHD